jgi:cysteine synthase A
MSDNRARIYIGLSFLAGILLTLGFKDVYPDLERRFRRKRRTLTSLEDHPALRTEVKLTDNTQKHGSLVEVSIVEGIEGCIGNTPLFKIRSLSEATGCEIFAKAEVFDDLVVFMINLTSCSFSMVLETVQKIGWH